MKLSTDELIALGAALEIALNTSGVEEALTATKNCHDAETVKAMMADWRKLRGRITGQLACPEDADQEWEGIYDLIRDDSEPHVIGMEAPTPVNDPVGRFRLSDDAGANADAAKDEDARRDEDPRRRP